MLIAYLERERPWEREAPDSPSVVSRADQVHLAQAGPRQGWGWKEAGDAGVVVSEPWSSPAPANAASSSGTEEKEHALLADLPPVEGTPR